MTLHRFIDSQQGFRSCRFCRFARFFKNLLKSLQYPLKSMQNMQMTPCTSKTLISNESNSVHRSKNFRNVLLWVSGSHTTIFGSNGWKFRKQMSKHRNEVFGKNLFLGQKFKLSRLKNKYFITFYTKIGDVLSRKWCDKPKMMILNSSGPEISK